MIAKVVENKKFNNEHFTEAVERTFHKYNSHMADICIRAGKKPRAIKSKKPQYISTIETLFATFIHQPYSKIFLRASNNQKHSITNEFGTRFPLTENKIINFLDGIGIVSRDTVANHKGHIAGESRTSTFSLTDTGRGTFKRLDKKIKTKDIVTSYDFKSDPIRMRNKLKSGKGYNHVDFKLLSSFLNNKSLVREVKTMGKQVIAYNKMLDDENHSVIWSDKNGIKTDICQKLKLYRSFTTYKDFSKGGRFYSPMTNIHKYLRHYIIDGEESVELDYSCMFLSMAYHKAGANTSNMDDLYNIAGYEKEYRTAIKIIVNAIFNIGARSGLKKPMLDKMELYEKEISNGKNPDVDKMKGIPLPDNMSTDDRKKLIDDVVVHMLHSPIKNFIFRKINADTKSGKKSEPIGMFLMGLEAKIAANIIADFMEIDEICIPVHDSMIVKKSLEPMLMESMKKHYYEEIGCSPFGIK